MGGPCYYSRARNLHACAKAIVKDFAGRFPDDEARLLKLPGLGPYTAAAIAAIAFGRVLWSSTAMSSASSRGFMRSRRRFRRPSRSSGKGRPNSPRASGRRLCAGDDGHWGDHLRAETAGLRDLSVVRWMRWAGVGRSGAFSGQSAKTRAAATAGGRVFCGAEGWRRPRAHAGAKRPAGGHD